jgi:hypothetical protein
MTQPQSQVSPVLWYITDKFCPRIIAIDGIILSVSRIGHSHLFDDRLWLASPIKLIYSTNVYGNKLIKSIVIENKSQLEGIEAQAISDRRFNLSEFFTRLDFWV